MVLTIFDLPDHFMLSVFKLIKFNERLKLARYLIIHFKIITHEIIFITL